ncbi:hypothetical protein EJB05_27191 [Eragrostis curvula]|uniref:Uncharacterized protein n=1 Tax=Eragrostis curvula TaxID=38414 RepID=A0A5J9UNH1_9POAL|nr:hypothetical protein EJB05_27191 [Eragrostis curvula]
MTTASPVSTTRLSKSPSSTSTPLRASRSPDFSARIEQLASPAAQGAVRNESSRHRV